MNFRVTAAEFTESEAKIAITRGGTAAAHTITLDSETGLAFRRWLKHIGKEAAMPDHPPATPEPIALPPTSEPTAEVPNPPATPEPIALPPTSEPTAEVPK